MHLYLASNPRVLYLVTSPHEEQQECPSRALVFRRGDGPFKTVVEFLHKDKIDFSSLVCLTKGTVKGCLGLNVAGNNIFLALITDATDIGNTRPSGTHPESVARIREVSFYSLTSGIWDVPLTAATDPVLEFNGREPHSQTTPTVFGHPCMPLMKLLSSGTFYYAFESNWDLSSRLAVRLANDSERSHDTLSFDERFVWNDYMLHSLINFRESLVPHERDDLDRCHFIVLAIRGYVGVWTKLPPVPPMGGSPMAATIALISRLERKRAGTRFNTRGVDDDGNTANFVETEYVFTTDQHCVSYVQARGSVPLFWEQQGLQMFRHRIQTDRLDASQPAFERHLHQLMKEYGSIHAINLLGQKKGEAFLTNAYVSHLQKARTALGDDLGITHFDFHNSVKIGGHESVVRGELKRMGIVDHLVKYGFTKCDAATNDIITNQRGVFRINCLDCLDRTNIVQDIMSRMILEEYLDREGIDLKELWTHHRELWVKNGDDLSRIYAGTGALHTSFTRTGRRTLAGFLSRATKTVSRAYINNFQDDGKQFAIDMLLGNIKNQLQVTIDYAIDDSVRTTLGQLSAEYSTSTQSSVLPWLPPRPNMNEPDTIVPGFQKIIPITAQQIAQTYPEISRIWKDRTLDTLDRVLSRSEQLVELESPLNSKELSSSEVGRPDAPLDYCLYPPKTIADSDMSSRSLLDLSTSQWYYIRIVKAQIFLPDRNPGGAREDADPDLSIRVLLDTRTLITCAMQSQRITHAWDEPATEFCLGDLDSDSVVKIKMYHVAGSRTSPSGHNNDKLLCSRSIAIQDLEKFTTESKDIPLDLRHRPGDPKWATVTVQFGILKPGSTFAQTRSSPTALGFTPPDTGQLKKIKDIGDKRPASGKHFENQEQVMESQLKGPNNVQPSKPGHREYWVPIRFRNMEEDNIIYSYHEKGVYIEHNLAPHFEHRRDLLLHTNYNFQFRKGLTTQQDIRVFTKEGEVRLSDYFR